MKNITATYYDENASSFIENTINCDMSVQYNLFLKYLNKEAKTILDLGFGSARDILYFEKLGYEVYGIDSSLVFCDKAKSLGLTNIYNLDMVDLNFKNLFDGIWACASLLHLDKENISLVLAKCYEALKNNGIMYLSFKYGNFSGIRNKRYFTDLTLDLFQELLDKNKFIILEHLQTSDVRPGRADEKWLNIIIKKRPC